MPTFKPENVTLSQARTGSVPSAFGELIIKRVIENSKIMQLGNIIEMTDQSGNPVMEKSFTYLAEGPGAYWVGEGEVIETSKAKWLTAKIVAKKLGVIIPVSREFLHYSLSDFFSEIQPLIAEAFYKKFDEAGILNINNPFGASIDQSAMRASNEIAKELTYDSILELQDKLTENGMKANGFISSVRNSTLLRGATKTENGVALSIYDRHTGQIDGLPTVELDSVNMKPGTLYAGDFNYLYYGIPYTLSYKVSEDATLSSVVDEQGKPINLFERELIALRATMDVGLMVVNDKAFAKAKAKPIKEDRDNFSPAPAPKYPQSV